MVARMDLIANGASTVLLEVHSAFAETCLRAEQLELESGCVLACRVWTVERSVERISPTGYDISTNTDAAQVPMYSSSMFTMLVTRQGSDM